MCSTVIDFEKAFDSLSWEFSYWRKNNIMGEIITIKLYFKNSAKWQPFGNNPSREGMQTGWSNITLSVCLGRRISCRGHQDQQRNRGFNYVKTRTQNLSICGWSQKNLPWFKFQLISGLKVNTEKTKVIKIWNWGVGRDNRTTLCNEMNLEWTQNFDCLGIK